jgi:abortive infection bacteriophage resistance protein
MTHRAKFSDVPHCRRLLACLSNNFKFVARRGPIWPRKNSNRDQNAIAMSYSLADGAILKSWMRTFNFVRNVAAHHSRLWNRRNPEIPVLPPLERCRWLEVLHKDDEAHMKLFGALTCMQLIMRAIAPSSLWHEQLKAHVATFPQSDLLPIRAAGFPSGWEELPVWSYKACVAGSNPAVRTTPAHAAATYSP